MTSELDNQYQRSLEAFRDGVPAAQIEALVELTRTKQIHNASKSPQFVDGLERLLRNAGEGAPDDRALAVAGLERSIATVKSLQRSHRARLSATLKMPLPPAQSLADVDNRRYVVIAVRESDQPWGPN